VSVVRCTDGADVLVRFGQVAPDAVVLPALLGVIDAGTVVTTIRRSSSTPVFLGVALAETDAAGPAVLAGAAAIIARPYVAEEILHHLDRRLPDIESRLRLSCGPLELDPRAYSVRLHGRELSGLPLKEFELLRFLMMHADQVVTPDQIREAVWGCGEDAPSSNTVAVHIARLRARIGGSELLRTVRGLGYRLVVPEVAGVTEPR
jgi:DNA-binding response OmpR family regulator